MLGGGGATDTEGATEAICKGEVASGGVSREQANEEGASGQSRARTHLLHRLIGYLHRCRRLEALPEQRLLQLVMIG